MREEHAPGLAVDWLNGWMAALGVCVLLPEVRLRWTDDPVPTACFAVQKEAPPLAELVEAALPTEQDLSGLAIARLERTVSLPCYADRARLARKSRDTTLSSTVTDLVADVPQTGGLPHSPFDPAAPGTTGTLWDRAKSCRRDITDPVGQLARTFAGRGIRTKNNGLGFDVRRLVAGVQDAEKRVDPVVELLAFCSLSLFPLRGNGKADPLARGWQGRASGTGSFRWCAWSKSIDQWGIDALLDLLPKARRDKKLAQRLGVARWYRSVPFRHSERDMTRAYGAEPEG
jgi:hypothetical protein